MRKTTALLIFARTASEESKHKRFLASKAFFEYQNNKVLNIAKSSGLDYYWIHDRLQVGNSFEERFLNAIQNLFELGYNEVITIGNDSPELQKQHIHQALTVLKTNDMCFGPSHDGGFYLWGLKKDDFLKEDFLNFSWNTSTLLSEILEELKSKSISCLEVLAEMDRQENAIYFVSKSDLTSKLKLILESIVSTQKTFVLNSPLYFTSNYSPVYYNKGSPL